MVIPPEPAPGDSHTRYWRQLLGAKFTEELIDQAHQDAERERATRKVRR